MRKIKVLVVDDSALIRQMFTQMLSNTPNIEVLNTACDPYDAREKIKRLNPDVITLDIEMPKMDGLSFLKKIMALRPMPVIMVSSLTQKGADITLEALENGAFDTIAKPVERQTPDNLALLESELVAKVCAAADANVRAWRPDAASNIPTIPYRPHAAAPHLIAIGASTGGVEALRDLFMQLPNNAPPIVIAQHMPERFTTSFAARLNDISQLEVTEAVHNQRLQPGHAYIAPGGRHLKVVRIGGDLLCRLDDGAPVSGHKPSVDVLFESVAMAVGANAVGVILTGMGKDGGVGLKMMHDKGAFTVGQDQATCVVYGMPNVAKKLGAIQIEAPLSAIAGTVLEYCERHRGAA
jgi:two-component system chemotaxis response regulator CheB